MIIEKYTPCRRIASSPVTQPMAADTSTPAPTPGWIDEIFDMCSEADAAFFFKQWGGARPKSGGRLLEGEEWNGFPSQIVPRAIMSELQQ